MQSFSRTSSQASAPATPSDNNKTPRPTHQPATIRDCHLETMFDPTWMPGPNVFSYAQEGTVVHPETYQPEPYPGYHDRSRVIDSTPVQSALSRGFVTKDPKWWKNVAITEQDDAEFEALQARTMARMKTVEVWEQQMYNMYYGHPQRGVQGSHGAQQQAMCPYPPPPPSQRQ